jgi:hypothetical protein
VDIYKTYANKAKALYTRHKKEHADLLAEMVIKSGYKLGYDYIINGNPIRIASIEAREFPGCFVLDITGTKGEKERITYE